MRYAGRSEIIVVDSLSDQNPLLKQIRRAVSRGALTEDGFAVAEGIHLVEEARAAKCEIRAVIVAESAQTRFANLEGARAVSDKTFRDLASTETPQGVLALVRPRKWQAHELLGPNAMVIALDGIQDPGNAGAIVRAAEAFGATGVVFLKGTVNPYNPKCLRGSAGSAFRVPITTELDFTGLTVYAAMPHADITIGDVDFRGPCAMVIGSESRGVSPDWVAHATGVRIDTAGVESLNAAVAAGILLYEARRQRTR